MSRFDVLTIFLICLVPFIYGKVPRTDVSVSGISSGGAMATQLHVAFSKDISGCGILAGPPYYCGGNGLTTALCMTGPASFVSVTALQLKIKSYTASGSIDNPSYMVNDSVYVFSGKYDTVAYPGVVKINEELYSRLGAHVKTNFDMAAHHGFPTEDYGSPCSSLNSQSFINNCKFNLAYDMLNHIYGGNLIKPSSDIKTPLIGQLLLFDQNAFVNPPVSWDSSQSPTSSLSSWIKKSMVLYNPAGWTWSTSGLFNLTMTRAEDSSDQENVATGRSVLSSLDKQGFVYFPSACANGKKCPIHVALHGCAQGKSVVGDVFATKAGYLEVAELNNVIVMFPQVVKSLALPVNPMGCWDWWGYSSIYYATQGGPQMSAIKQMIDTVRMIVDAFTVTQ